MVSDSLRFGSLLEIFGTPSSFLFVLHSILLDLVTEMGKLVPASFIAFWSCCLLLMPLSCQISSQLGAFA